MVEVEIKKSSSKMTIAELSSMVLGIARTRKFIWSLLFIGAFGVVILSQYEHKAKIRAAILDRARLIHSSASRLWKTTDPKRTYYENLVSYDKNPGNDADEEITTTTATRTPVSYAIYAAHTPNGEGLRTFDYAFYLPLTALTWERIGFISFIVIIGSRCEWENNPTLRVTLNYLKERKAIVTFVPTPLEYRMMLSQTARIFGANMDDFPGQPDDYLITSDSDLWPIAKSFYVRPPGKDLVLVHGYCCGEFLYKGVKYRMYPMGNIGATVSTWRQILNEGHVVGKDTESILDYFEEEYGAHIRKPVRHASAEWYFDQKLVSIRIAQWMERNGNETVTIVNNGDFDRVDRIAWNPMNLTQPQFEKKYDAHMPGKIFQPARWNKTLPLIKLLFGADSEEVTWSSAYARDFYNTTQNYIEFNN